MTNLRTNLNEASFEEHIEKTLVEMNGYISRDNEKYDRELAMDAELVLEFLRNTQQEKLEHIKELRGTGAEDELMKRIDGEIGKRGILDVLKKGVTCANENFDLMYSLPVSNLNQDAQDRFAQNIFSVMRQVYFSPHNEKSIDLGIFINGLPVATAELKNEMTGQNVNHAKAQYKNDRDKREKLLSFKRCLAHFAVDTNLVYMTTRLNDSKTFFLPFNKGFEGGAGNPNAEDKHKTYYLWEDVWSRESWSDLIQNFITVTKDEKDKETLIFPRYHQRNVVKRITKSIIGNSGKNYLIQHSAGSGKSMTIAWTAYRLAQLHDKDNEKVFDSVFVITDRRALDKQLREVLETFQPVSGFLYTVREDKGAKTGQLTEAIESGAKVITTTIAVFPYVADVIGNFQTKKFAILVDEAHSSQGGESARAINEVLQNGDGEKEEKTDEDFILKQLESRKQGENISYFAFTATPKQETLEKFGERNTEGGFAPFSLYSMKQAIEEGFVLDVLKNYTTYKQYFKILEDIPENPEVPRSRAMSAIRRYIRNHPETIEQKIGFIVEHYKNTISELLHGRAKAMIVTNSRESAVRYKLALDKYLREQGYVEKSLVAFSGELKIDGQSYTEAGINGISENQTIKEFEKDEYKFLVVANKHQTGFDQPLLCGMYVDKTLSGVNAVQTLSRLNRMSAGKKEVFVLDFANTTAEIKDAFDEYYTTTILSEGLDINIVNDTVLELENIYKISDEVLGEFVLNIENLSKDEIHQAVNSQLDVIVKDFFKKIQDDKDVVKDFKAKADFYLKIYPFAQSVFGFVGDNAERQEKLYWFLKYFIKKLPREGRMPLNISELLDMENIKVIIKERKKSVKLDTDDSDIYDGMDVPGAGNEDGETDFLENIIKKANEEWGAEFGKEQEKTLNGMQKDFSENEQIINMIKNNPLNKRAVSVKFNNVFGDKLNEQYDVDHKLWETISANKDLRKFVEDKMLNSLFRGV